MAPSRSRGLHRRLGFGLPVRDDQLPKVLKLRLIVVFAAVVGTGIFVVGCLFNAQM